MRLIRPALFVAGLMLFITHGLVFVFHMSLLFKYNSPPSFGAVLYGLFITLTGIILVWGLIKTHGQKRGSYTFVCTFSIALSGALFVWLVTDAGPVKGDYTRADVGFQANGSYRHLAVLNQADPGVLETLNKKIEGNKDKIRNKAFDDVYEETKALQDAVDALDRFDTICDLPPDTAFNPEIPFLKFNGLRAFTDIQGQYFLFKVSDKKGRQAVDGFCRFHRVARKAMENATCLINKIIFATIVKMNIETASVAVQNEAMDKQTLAVLKANFTPLSKKELSLKRPVIAEYLMVKNAILEQITPENFLDYRGFPSGTVKKDQPFQGLYSSVVYYLLYKPNQSLADMKGYFDLLINDPGQYPNKATSASSYLEIYAETPPIRNMVGWILNTMAMPDFGTYQERLEAIRKKAESLRSLMAS